MATYIYDEALLQKIKGWTQSSNLHVYGVEETRNLFEVMADESNDSPIELPIISLRRNRGYTITEAGTTRRPLSYEGFSITDKDFESYQDAQHFCEQMDLDESVILPKSYWANDNRFQTYAQAEEYCLAHGINVKEIHTATREKYYIKTDDIHPNYTESIRAIPISISYQLDVYTRYAKEADLLMRNLIFNIINYPGFTILIPTANLVHTARLVLNDTIEDNSNIPERFIEGNLTRLTANISVDNARLWDTRKLRNAEIKIVLDDIYEPEYDVYFSANLQKDTFDNFEKDGE